ncbi:MAG: hypothetical protein R2690_09690 [Acidimicrobiales bacterium]
MIGACESCGREDEVVVRVRRMYVTPEAWDTPERGGRGRGAVVLPCRTHYPHEAIDGGTASP